MNKVITKKSSSPSFSIGTLVRDAQRLLGALQDGTIGTAVVGHLSAEFVADFTARLALVAKLDNDQSTAFGVVSSLTAEQNKARRDFALLTQVVRRIAKFALVGQDTVLRSEFQVGEHAPKGLPALLARGRKVVTACQTYAAELAPHGWSVDNTTALATALETLTGIDRTQETSKDEKQGLTAERAAATKRLYQQCVVIQDAARVVYAIASAPADPATAEARARFLLGEFPPRRGAVAVVAPVPPTTPVVVVAPAHSAPDVTAAAPALPAAA